MLGIGGQSGGLSGIGGGTCAASGYFASSSWYSTTAIQPTWTAGSYITLTGPTEAGGYVYYTIGSNTPDHLGTYMMLRDTKKPYIIVASINQK